MVKFQTLSRRLTLGFAQAGSRFAAPTSPTGRGGAVALVALVVLIGIGTRRVVAHKPITSK